MKLTRYHPAAAVDKRSRVGYHKAMFSNPRGRGLLHVHVQHLTGGDNLAAVCAVHCEARWFVQRAFLLSYLVIH